MKKVILMVIVFAGFAMVAQADFSLPKWQFQKDISNVENGLIELTLDNEVFANSTKNLTDLRVIDENNREVPYKLIAAKSEEKKQEYRPKITNNSVVAGKYSMAIMDLGEAGIITNSLAIKTSSENFQRNVIVYGSSDGNNWNILKSDASIYDYTFRKGNAKSQNTQVSFPDSTFKFLKIEISDSENSPVKIDSIIVNQFIKKNAKEFTLEPAFDITEDESQKISTLLVDLGQGGIPTNKILLSISDNNFNRGVVISSSNDKNTPNWRTIGQGYVFRYDTSKFKGENTTLSFDETTDRFIKITIYNNDDKPLGISKLGAMATFRELVFQAESRSGYRLFYGNSNANAPAYDLEKYFQYLDLSVSRKAGLGAQKNNAGYIAEKKPITERNKVIMPIALVLTGGLLLLLVYKFLKK
ncbi:MAG: hypothetical protein ACD_9C00236G0003 [uncultured bacterium]|nr:MAG: hypothetical protein ACD_9C00236G0003 [uncultured bacterium]